MNQKKGFAGWKIIFLSFLGAATFWFFNALGKEYSYRIKYPITFPYNQDSLVAIAPLPQYIDVDVSGGGWDLLKELVWFGSEPMPIELKNPVRTPYLTHSYLLPVVSEQLSQFKLNFLFSDTLFIQINRKVSKKVSIEIDSLGIDIEKDHLLTSPLSFSPDSITLYGPTSFFDTLGSTFLVRIDEQNIENDFEEKITLEFPENLEMYSEPPAVQVQFQVEALERLELETTAETLGFPADSSVYLENSQITLMFSVLESKKTDYFIQDFEIIADYTKVKEDKVPVLVLSHPEEIFSVVTRPDSLSVISATNE